MIVPTKIHDTTVKRNYIDAVYRANFAAELRKQQDLAILGGRVLAGLVGPHSDKARTREHSTPWTEVTSLEVHDTANHSTSAKCFSADATEVVRVRGALGRLASGEEAYLKAVATGKVPVVVDFALAMPEATEDDFVEGTMTSFNLNGSANFSRLGLNELFPFGNLFKPTNPQQNYQALRLATGRPHTDPGCEPPILSSTETFQHIHSVVSALLPTV